MVVMVRGGVQVCRRVYRADGGAGEFHGRYVLQGATPAEWRVERVFGRAHEELSDVWIEHVEALSQERNERRYTARREGVDGVSCWAGGVHSRQAVPSMVSGGADNTGGRAAAALPEHAAFGDDIFHESVQ